MKRLVVLPIILMLLCGCSPMETAKPVIENTSFVAQIDYNDSQYTCDVEVFEKSLNLTVVEPNEINGLKLKVDKNDITAEYKGISYTPDFNNMPQGAVIQILYSIIENIKNKTIEFSGENGAIQGEVNSCDYVFTFSPSGLPLTLEIDDIDLKIEFKNVALK